MYLFFDTETTGLPKRWNAPVTDFGKLAQISTIGLDHVR